MWNSILEHNKDIKFFLVKSSLKKNKTLQDFKSYLMSSWKTKKENVSENIDNFLYK